MSNDANTIGKIARMVPRKYCAIPVLGLAMALFVFVLCVHPGLCNEGVQGSRRFAGIYVASLGLGSNNIALRLTAAPTGCFRGDFRINSTVYRLRARVQKKALLGTFGSGRAARQFTLLPGFLMRLGTKTIKMSRLHRGPGGTWKGRDVGLVCSPPRKGDGWCHGSITMGGIEHSFSGHFSGYVLKGAYNGSASPAAFTWTNNVGNVPLVKVGAIECSLRQVAPALLAHRELRAGHKVGEYINVKDGSVLVWIPAGEFRMGYVKGRGNERPVHTVVFPRGFFLGKYEVTWKEYMQFCRSSGQVAPVKAGGFYARKPQYPVFGISYDSAQAYCRWAGLRLPSEAEWEYAARGSDGRLYPWGNEAPGRKRCNFGRYKVGMDVKHWKESSYSDDADGYEFLAPVGSFPRGVSPFGCEDMAGNVSEWCEDMYHVDYKNAPSDGSAWMKGGTPYPVARGGAWDSAPALCRSTFRDFILRSQGFPNLGFRVAASVQ